MKHQMSVKSTGYVLIAEFIESINQRKLNFIIMQSELKSTCISIAESILKNDSIKHLMVREIKTGKIVWNTHPVNGYFEKGAWIITEEEE